MRLMPPTYEPPTTPGCFVADRFLPVVPMAQLPADDSLTVAFLTLALALMIGALATAATVIAAKRP